MNSRLVVDLFVEDTAHEEFLKPLVRRLAAEEGRSVRIRVRSALGGHPRALTEFRLYQRVAGVMVTAERSADLVVVAIDANCSSFQTARNRIREEVLTDFRDRVVTACPDPHIERWYLADLRSFKFVVGRGPDEVEEKCARGHYKGILKSAVTQAGHPPSDGVDFAAALAAGMDLYRAGRSDSSFKAFLDEFRSALRRHSLPSEQTSDEHR